MNTNEMLEQVIRRNDTWQGHRLFDGHVNNHRVSANSDCHGVPGLATGYTSLDAQLQQGGWPLDSTIELLSDGCGLGAMGLFLPAMERLSEQGRWQVFIAPPYIPYAPLLAARGIDTRQILLVHPQNRLDLLWATEQALRSTTCSAVFSWLGAQDYLYSELRKLQLAAANGNSLAVLFRPNQAALNHAPSSLRLQMREYRKVHILKQRGGNQAIDVALSPAEDEPLQPQLWELPVWRANTHNHAARNVSLPVA
jgi:protein ImuA